MDGGIELNRVNNIKNQGNTTMFHVTILKIRDMPLMDGSKLKTSGITLIATARCIQGGCQSMGSGIT